jgi:hypothetical protein
LAHRLAVLTGTLLVVVIIGGCGDSGESDIPTRVVTVKPDPPGSPQTLERLTQRQRDQTERIIARDRRFRRIVGAVDYHLTRAIPLGTQDNRGRQPREVLIGTRTEVFLNEPRPSVVTTWPLLEFPENAEEAKQPTYKVMLGRLTVRGLRSLAVLVDLKRRTVAGMSPLEANEVKYPPGWPTVRAPTGE